MFSFQIFTCTKISEVDECHTGMWVIKLKLFTHLCSHPVDYFVGSCAVLIDGNMADTVRLVPLEYVYRD